jgi:WD40 repeat protein
VKKKSIHEFDLFLVQEIRAHSDSIWVARFSPCGNFMATGGKDAVLRIWQVNCVGKLDSVDVTFADCWKVFHKAPYREYREHEHDILDIAWCKERPYLLLSCSLDQKVILWDLNKERHMQIFEHPDIPVKI